MRLLPFFSKKPKHIPSTHYNTRGDTDIEYIILHYTDTKTLDDAITIMDERKVSAHYVVDYNGQVIQCVHDNNRAWHAGVSYWRGQTDMNATSIGIEIVNPGVLHGYQEFPEKQIQSVMKLCHEKMKAFDIPADNILAHSDIAPARKIDPDYLFPWQTLATAGIGVFPHPSEHDYQTAQDILLRPGEFDALLLQYGYDPQATPEHRTQAFHRRFYPEKFLSGDPNTIDVASVARLLSLMHQTVTP